jgi:acetaldehyde dehydrogenase (acetylating)
MTVDKTRLNIAILGSGNIGTDLLVKVLRSEHLACGAFIGRNLNSPGMQTARRLGVVVSPDSLAYIEDHPDCCGLVFDATTAKDHLVHAPVLRKLGKIVIDLTPAKVGVMCVPAVNMAECLAQDNVNMVTCGGQASIPVAYVIGQTQKDVDYIEVVSSIASRSAGPGTRINLDEYIHTTEHGVRVFSGARRTKAILNLNPAQPCIDMQTTIMAKVGEPDLVSLTEALTPMVRAIQRYVPGYALVLGPLLENNRIIVTIRVRGLGDYLPAYAGNLDIINCAALAMAEQFALHQRGRIEGRGES